MRKPMSFMRQRRKSNEKTSVASDAVVVGAVTNSVSTAAKNAARRSFISKRLGKDPADAAAQPDPIGKTLLLYGASKIASRSLPGAVLVGSAMLAKSALKRRALRRTQSGPLALETALENKPQAENPDAEK